MAQIEVRLTLRDGGEQRIDRPLHFVGGKPAVTYKGLKWPVDAKGHLDLRTAKPFSENSASRPASWSEAAKFKVSDAKSPADRPPQDASTKAAPGRATSLLPHRDPGNSDFDPSQRNAITAPSIARLQVDAGPGAGKTAVACARVAWLATKADIAPSQIWVISFTRSAVQEIRSRIQRLVADPMIGRAVQSLPSIQSPGR